MVFLSSWRSALPFTDIAHPPACNVLPQTKCRPCRSLFFACFSTVSFRPFSDCPRSAPVPLRWPTHNLNRHPNPRRHTRRPRRSRSRQLVADRREWHYGLCGGLATVLCRRGSCARTQSACCGCGAAMGKRAAWPCRSRWCC